MRSSRFPAPNAASATAIALAALALGGCTVSGQAEAADAEVAPSATGIVVVEGSAANEGSRSEAVARFVRARAGVVDDDALRMVGATVDFPAIGSCESLASLRGSPAARAIALLDVGGVTLMAGESATSLQPRQLPDVADLVSGVVYSARTDELSSKSAYLLRIEGSANLDIPAFVVSAKSPGEPLDVRIANDDGRTGAVALSPTRTVDITWEPGTGEDAIYVDVSPVSSAPATRCLFDDAGHATLPASAFGSLEEGALAVHRLHREAFEARGISPGEVRFDFARVVAFTRR